MDQNDFQMVMEDMVLEDGTIWPLPIVLDVDGDIAADLTPGKKAPLIAPDGTTIGLLDVEEVFTYNDERVARQIFDTSDRSHPGVRSLYDKDDFLVG
jgi:sulfate adenylyltransferase